MTLILSPKRKRNGFQCKNWGPIKKFLHFSLYKISKCKFSSCVWPKPRDSMTPTLDSKLNKKFSTVKMDFQQKCGHSALYKNFRTQCCIWSLVYTLSIGMEPGPSVVEPLYFSIRPRNTVPQREELCDSCQAICDPGNTGRIHAHLCGLVFEYDRLDGVECYGDLLLWWPVSSLTYCYKWYHKKIRPS